MKMFEKSQARKNQKGFTLLELLVTVGIMAAVAGTATIALQDTTARASAAAHVLHMDQINEGIMTYRALPNNNNSYPNNFDSLMETPTAGDATAAVPLSVLGVDVTNGVDSGVSSLAPFTLPAGVAGADSILEGVGITQLRYAVAAAAFDPADDGDCSDMAALIASRGNAVVPGNIFMSPAANGCGQSITLDTGDDVLIWSGGNERVLGAGAVEPAFDATTGLLDLANTPDDAKILMAVGAGPSSSLFDASQLGGMSSVPVYRHVANTEYNRYIVLFHIGDVSGNAFSAADQVVIVNVVDGAGDTKEEELGEWDGTRNTI